MPLPKKGELPLNKEIFYNEIQGSLMSIDFSKTSSVTFDKNIEEVEDARKSRGLK